MLRIVSFTFNAFSENTYLLIDEATRATAIVDPGAYSPAEQQTLRTYIAQEKLDVQYLLNTHAHIDHVLGNAFVLKQYPNLPFLLHTLAAHPRPAHAAGRGHLRRPLRLPGLRGRRAHRRAGGGPGYSAG